MMLQPKCLLDCWTVSETTSPNTYPTLEFKGLWLICCVTFPNQKSNSYTHFNCAKVREYSVQYFNFTLKLSLFFFPQLLYMTFECTIKCNTMNGVEESLSNNVWRYSHLNNCCVLPMFKQQVFHPTFNCYTFALQHGQVFGELLPFLAYCSLYILAV